LQKLNQLIRIDFRFTKFFWLLRPIYTEELPRVAAHDSLLVLLRPGVAVPRRARAQNYPTQQNKQRIVRGYSWQLSVDWPLDSISRRGKMPVLLPLQTPMFLTVLQNLSLSDILITELFFL